MNKRKGIRERISNKNVLFIPVVSMRSYETKKYKLNCDGNMARLLSIIYQSSIKKATIVVPDKSNIDLLDFRELSKKIYDKGLSEIVEFAFNEGYGDNAKETRESERIFLNLEKGVGDIYDLIITEPQICTKQLIDDESIENQKLIYWCVASETINYSPWFTREFKEYDKYISSRISTACATQSQVEYLKGLSYKDEFYNANFSDVNIVFFPFRLSDPSYKAELFIDMIKRLNDDGVKNFKVIITDPNTSDISDDFTKLENVIKVQADFSVYLSILKGKPIIPYFENADEVKHISIEEMVKYGCEIICYENKELPDTSNIIKVKSDETFYTALKKTIQKN